MRTSPTDNIVTYLVSEGTITYSMPDNWTSTEREQEDSLTDDTDNNG